MRNEIAIETLVRAGWTGRFWYESARSEIAAVATLARFDRNDFAAILAATSPRCVVRRNIRLALSWMINGELPKGTMKSITNACERWTESKEFGPYSPKVSAFYKVLSGCDETIVWDTHMIQAFVGRDKIRKTELTKAESRLRSVARDLDLTPCQCQAAIWAGWRGIQGWTRSDYPVLEEYSRFIGENN